MHTTERPPSTMMAISNAMVRLHKEQFGRGPVKARSSYAGPDAILCTLEDVLLPAERKLVAIGEASRVRDTRVSFQVATEPDFVAAVEQIVYRKVRAFASALDVKADTVFEIFALEPRAGSDVVELDGPAADQSDAGDESGR
jgi:uncharacterized protein YbcI